MPNILRRRAGAIFLMTAALLAAMLMFFGGTPSDAAATVCDDVQGDRPTFLANQAPAGSNFFGPDPASADIAQLKQLMHNGRCVDPALAVSHASYSARDYNSLADGGVGAQNEYIANADKWKEAIKAMEAKEANAVKVEVVQMAGNYKTMYQVLGGPVPTIHQDNVDKPTFAVLRFTYANGTVDNYKINCHFQPVDQDFGPTPKRGHKPKPRCLRDCVPVTVPKCRKDCYPTTTQPTCKENCGPTTTIKQDKCAGQTGPFCGSNTSGPEQQMQPSTQTPTPGYQGPGHAENVRDKQTNPSTCQQRGDCPSQYGTDSGSHDNNPNVPRGGDNGDQSGTGDGISREPEAPPSGDTPTQGDPCNGDPNC